MRQRPETVASVIFLACVMVAVAYLVLHDQSGSAGTPIDASTLAETHAGQPESPPAPEVGHTGPAPGAELAEIAGTVVTEARTGVSGAVVNIAPTGTYPPVTTAQDGSFTLSGLPIGMFALTAEKAGVGHAKLTDVPAPSRQILLTLQPTCTVSGQVVSAMSGKPLDAFDVAAVAGELPLQDALMSAEWVPVSDPRGAFRVTKHTNGGPFTIVAHAAGMAPTAITTRPLSTGQEEAGLLIQLGPGTSVRGRVVNARREPVAGATVAIGDSSAWPSPARKTQTDSSGTYRLDGLLPDDRYITAWSAHHIPDTAEIEPKLGATITADFVLGDGVTIEGRVLRGAEPLYPCRVSFSSMESLGAAAKADTDADGHYLLRSVAPGLGSIGVRYADTGGHRAYIVGTVGVPEGGTDTMDIVIPEHPVVIEGVVTVNGMPGHGVSVSATVSGSAGCTHVSEKTDTAGRYRIEVPIPGPTRVCAIASGENDRGAGSSEVRLDTEEGQVIQQDFHLEPSTIVGSVTSLGEDEEAGVSLLHPQSELSVIRTMQDVLGHTGSVVKSGAVNKDGTFQIDSVAPGTYLLLVVAGQGSESGSPDPATPVRTVSQTVTVAEGTMVEIHLVLP